ncbi:unnamed protein product [Blepharisma stoltei]|uniref:Uncharacterized protein n=1 Tax=Blepharisma stoltei TaxID=1481888 RepID=A0AAU9JCZ4_9CILI|nr:unnamed protein product [Blepharisma stoltei]
MFNDDCVGCKNPIKRLYFYSKGVVFLCHKCQKICADEFPDKFSRSTVKNIDPRGENTPTKSSLNNLRKYGVLLTTQIGHRIHEINLKTARSQYKLLSKLQAIFKNAPMEQKIGLGKSLKLCYNRDYNLEEINNYLRPLGSSFEELADMFQYFYDHYIKKYMLGTQQSINIS